MISDTIVAAKPVLRIKNLKKSFGGQKVIDNLSVDLFKGEIVLLRGQNGAGKTTLLNILTGNIEPDDGVIEVNLDAESEEFKFPAKWWNEINPFNHFTPERIADKGIGRTWQEIRLFPSLSLRDNIAVAHAKQLGEDPLFGVIAFPKSAQENRKLLVKADARLARVGLKGRGESQADSVSLGQGKRVGILRAIEAGSRILFLDEPLAGLDGPGITDILEFLRDIADSRQLTLVIVEHVFNIPAILNIATKIWTLENGTVRVETPSNMVPEAKQEKYALDQWIESFAGAHGKILHESLGNEARLTRIIGEISGATPGVASTKVDDTDADVSDTVLAVDNLVVFRGNRAVIGQIDGNDKPIATFNLSLRKGELCILHAPNGWGKTTLLEALSGCIPVKHGRIILNNAAITKFTPWKRFDAGLSMLQSRDNIFPDLKVDESLWLSGIDETPAPLKKFAHRKTSSLSGGQKQRIAVHSMLSNEAFCCALLDEPFAALDAEGIEELTALLRQALKHGAVLIAIPAAHVSAIS